MKKYILLLAFCLFLVNCNTQTHETSTNTSTIENSENPYAPFEKEILKLYSKENITDIMVSPYSKGIEISLVTNSSNFSSEKFNKLANEIVKNFKNRYNFEDDLMIDVSLNYQPNPTENMETLFNRKVK